MFPIGNLVKQENGATFGTAVSFVKQYKNDVSFKFIVYCREKKLD